REQQPEVLAVGAWVQVIRAQRTIRDDDLARAWNTGDRLITRGFVPAQVGCRPCPRDRPSATVGVRRGIFVSYLPWYPVRTRTTIFQQAGASVIGSGRFASHLWISGTGATVHEFVCRTSNHWRCRVVDRDGLRELVCVVATVKGYPATLDRVGARTVS